RGARRPAAPPHRRGPRRADPHRVVGDRLPLSARRQRRDPVVATGPVRTSPGRKRRVPAGDVRQLSHPGGQGGRRRRRCRARDPRRHQPGGRLPPPRPRPVQRGRPTGAKPDPRRPHRRITPGDTAVPGCPRCPGDLPGRVGVHRARRRVVSDQLSAAAQAMGVPEPIVERSARARAAASGQSYEDILAAWAGGQAVAAAPADAPAEPPPEPPAEAPAEPAATDSEPAPAAAPAAPAEPAPAAAPAAVTPPPAPETVTPEEALEYPVVVTVPTAGIAERTGFSIPMWLGMLLLLVPAFGLIYLAVGSGATECGAGTALAADRVTGELVNCDGTPFEGRGAAGGGADFIAMGEEIYASCAGCHGPQGQGQGNFPALTGVTTTFSACVDHIEWVTLG